MIPGDDFLESGDDSLARELRGRRASFEDGAIRFLLTHLGLQTSIPDYEREIRQSTGRKAQLSCAWFYDEFPDCPVQWAVGRLWGISDIDMGHLFKSFTTTKVFQAFEKARKELDRDRPVAMIFGWPRVAKYMVIHTHFVDMEVRAPIFARPIGAKNIPHVIQELKTFLEGLSWRP